MRAFAAILIYFITVSQSNSQSIEDTVVYLFNGIEYNEVEMPKQVYNNEEIYTEFKRKNQNEVVVETTIISGKKRTLQSNYIKFRKIDGCYVDLEVSNGVGAGVDYRDIIVNINVDMSAARGIRFLNGSRVLFDGAKFSCEYRNEKDSKDTNGYICNIYSAGGGFSILNVGKVERVKRAFEYYREKYCSGSAF